LLEWQGRPHCRLNPLTGEWVLVSPQRTERPWQGQTEAVTAPAPVYDPSCYLCPGNERAGGHRNPPYTGTFAFENDYPALLADTPESHWERAGLMVAEGERGVCRVLCFSPRHDLTVARMPVPEIQEVIAAWRHEDAELSALPFVRYVQIFENRGQMMGASNPHPHCQIWANQRIPNEITKEQKAQQDWFSQRKHCLLCEYLALEEAGERLVAANAGFVAVVPFWALWPFETMVIARRHVGAMAELSEVECAELADILKQVTTRYDNLFRTSCPYSMGFHQRPLQIAETDGWHFHAHYYPPVLRSATIRKFMVGYEMLAMPQRDITPEAAAERLRSLPAVHYAEVNG
jgi:UDPglucose--hexose-1-phosphate uridylyltransferase